MADQPFEPLLSPSLNPTDDNVRAQKPRSLRRRRERARSDNSATYLTTKGIRPKPRQPSKVSGKWARLRKDVREGEYRASPDTVRRKIYSLLESHHPSAFYLQLALSLLIVFNVLLFILESEDTYANATPALFDIGEAVSTVIFTIEFGLRVWVVPEHKRASYKDPVWGRLRYLCSFMAVIDMLSIFPYYLEVVLGVALPTTTALRIFRVFRILKIEHYTNAMESIGRVFWINREILVIGCAISMVFLLCTATLIWVAEGQFDDEFSSIPRCIFLSVLMLTGQGIEYDGKDYGWFTRFSICITAVISVVLFTVPASMLTWGFENEAERLIEIRKERKKARKAAEKAGVTYVEPSTDSDRSWSTSTSTDERDIAELLSDAIEQSAFNPLAKPIASVGVVQGSPEEVANAVSILSLLPLEDRARVVAQILAAGPAIGGMANVDL